MRYCTKCGKELIEGQKFCTVCGTATQYIDEQHITNQSKDDKSNPMSAIKKGGMPITVNFLFFLIIFIGGYMLLISEKPLENDYSIPDIRFTTDYKYTITNNKATIINYIGNDIEVVIPSEIDGVKVTSIGAHTFYNCEGITSIKIPNGVISIDNGAFWGCKSLTSITIPSSVTVISYGAFQDTPWYRNFASDFVIANNILIGYKGNGISASIPYGIISIAERAFDGCTSLTSVTMPNSVTLIGNYAFSGCRNLASIIISNSVTSIGVGAFQACTNLTNITIPDGVPSIYISTFSNCTSLTSVTIPNSITTIGSFAFRECTSLTNITIPNSVTSIYGGAFFGCTSLKSAYFAGNAPEIDRDVFANTANNFKIYCKAKAKGWSNPWNSYPTATY